MPVILEAATAAHLRDARTLFLEYAESLGFSLCFQDFDKELAGLPGDYAPPWGRLLIAYQDVAPVGCVALHRIEGDLCEMKRLYVRPAARGSGLGWTLSVRIIEEARAIGYTRMRLDTIADRMQKAVAIYRRLGFVEIPPYRHNPVPGVLYMELDLVAATPAGHPARRTSDPSS